MSTENDVRHAKVREILQEAVSALDPLDRQERAQWCQEHDAHGVRLHVTDDDDLLEFTWGGRTLAVVQRSLLTDDEPLPPPTFVDEVPDTVPTEWTGEC